MYLGKLNGMNGIMMNTKGDLGAFVLQVINLINSNLSTEDKVNGALAAICGNFGFKRGFVYQTDGFRFFHLKENFGYKEGKLIKKF